MLVYRLPNVFGKWARPNYNSAVATFSYNIARGLPITINNPDVMMSLVYIDDVIKELVKALKGEENRKGNYCYVEPVHQVKLGYIAELLYSFKKSREERSVPKLDDPFIKKLYSNYLSYLEEDDFGYDLLMHKDHRGSFTEFLKTTDRGQVSVNISKPGITKGNHWHHTKNEKFLVVYGRGVIRFRKIGGEKVIEYYVSGEELQVIDIPVGYTHNIENLGETDMVTICGLMKYLTQIILILFMRSLKYENNSCRNGYVGLSNAVLLSQSNEVIALDIVEKVDLINQKNHQ